MDRPTDSVDEELSSGEDDNQPFNCEPVKKTIVSYENGQERAQPSPLSGLLALVRESAVRYNSRRQSTLHAANHGIATAYVDQDTSGTYDPKEVSTVIRRSRKRAANSTGHLDTIRKSIDKRPRRYAGYGYVVILELIGKALEYARSISPGPLSTASSEIERTDSDDEVSSEKHKPRKRRTRRSKVSRTVISRYVILSGMEYLFC